MFNHLFLSADRAALRGTASVLQLASTILDVGKNQ